MLIFGVRVFHKLYDLITLIWLQSGDILNLFLLAATITTNRSLKAPRIILRIECLYSISALPAEKFGHLDKKVQLKLFSKNEDFDKTKNFPSTDDNQVTNQNFSIHPDEVLHWKGRIQGKNIENFFRTTLRRTSFWASVI